MIALRCSPENMIGVLEQTRLAEQATATGTPCSRRARHAERTCLPLFSTLQHLATLLHACAILRLRKCGLCVREAQAFQPLLEACWLVLTAAVVCFSGKSILALFRC
jgi:hypothetical protein